MRSAAGGGLCRITADVTTMSKELSGNGKHSPLPRNKPTSVPPRYLSSLLQLGGAEVDARQGDIEAIADLAQEFAVSAADFQD